MLVLSRRVGEKILIGEDVELLVSSISGNKVRISIKAPRNVSVDREEVRKDKEVRSEQD